MCDFVRIGIVTLGNEHMHMARVQYGVININVNYVVIFLVM